MRKIPILDSPLKILFATAELSPLVSTGGLAEVANALPQALRSRGHDVRVVMPCYRGIPAEDRGEHACMCVAELGVKTEYGALRVSQVPGTDIPLYLIEHEGYFDREQPYGTGAHEYEDNAERFSFFSLAALDGISQTGWTPDVVHCNDWHTAPIPAFITTRFRDNPVWGKMPVLFTIHNLAYQGRYRAEKFARTGLAPEIFRPDCAEYLGDMNLMQAAIALASKISTVSPRYAREIQTLEYGAGLDGILRTRAEDLHGILNGVDYDLWNPRTDPYTAASFSAEDLDGKAVCKGALQDALGLPKADVPLFGVVSRLFWQKGLGLIVDAMDRFAERDLQIAVLGTGDPDLERRLAEVAARHPDKVAVALGFDVPLSHRIQAGSDFFLMPSRYEPCGLGQLYAMAYGTIPIVRRTGGLADSVNDLNPVHLRHGEATGVSFVPLTSQAVLRSVDRAIELYSKPEQLAQVRAACMGQDFSWDRSCQAYVKLYREAMAQP